MPKLNASSAAIGTPREYAASRADESIAFPSSDLNAASSCSAFVVSMPCSDNTSISVPVYSWARLVIPLPYAIPNMAPNPAPATVVIGSGDTAPTAVPVATVVPNIFGIIRAPTTICDVSDSARNSGNEANMLLMRPVKSSFAS